MDKKGIKVILFVTLIGLVACIVIIGTFIVRSKKDTSSQETIVVEETVETTVEVASQDVSNEVIPVDLKDINSLKTEINKDIYAWLEVPGTGIDFAVVQHPEDDTYYLNHNYDGSFGYPACIFTESYNSVTFEDPMTVVYGRNMKDGTMFAELHKFADKEFFDKNGTFTIWVDGAMYEYDIIAAYKSDNKRLMAWYYFEDEDVLEEYVRNVMTMDESDVTHIRENVSYSGKDTYVALETSIRDDDAHRYIVLGKRK